MSIGKNGGLTSLEDRFCLIQRLDIYFVSNKRNVLSDDFRQFSYIASIQFIAEKRLATIEMFCHAFRCMINKLILVYGHQYLI